MEVVGAVLRGSDGIVELPVAALAVEIESARDGGSRVLWRLPSAAGLGDLQTASLVLEPGIVEGEAFLRNGYQSWSFAGVDRATGPSPRSLIDQVVDTQHSLRRPPDGLDVLAESSQFLLCEKWLAGFARCARANGTILATADRIEALLDLRHGDFAEGDEMEPLVFWKTEPDEVESRARALDAFMIESGEVNGARAAAPHLSGWCSWYHYFHRITEEAMIANLSDAASRFGGLFDIFQLDDGYQRAIGDWLIPNEKFPSGVGALATKIAAEGFRPGIWFAPFLAGTDSSLMGEHPDWFATTSKGDPLGGMINFEWGGNGIFYCLDVTRDEVAAWLEATARSFVEMGYTYLKLDFTYAAAMPGRRSRPATGAELMKLGLDAVRRGAGEEALLLGCGMPLWPAIGKVDAMRIGPDVAPYWDPKGVVEGMTETMAATGNAYRNTLARSRMHRRLWVNDPDCVMLRRSETELTEEQIRLWADLCADSGELLLASDDLGLLTEADRVYWAELVERSAKADVRPGGTPWAPADPLAL